VSDFVWWGVFFVMHFYFRLVMDDSKDSIENAVGRIDCMLGIDVKSKCGETRRAAVLKKSRVRQIPAPPPLEMRTIPPSRLVT
jgi:hypothetical protein